MLLDKISHLTANDIDLKQLLSRQVGFIIIVSLNHNSYFHHNEHNHEKQLIFCMNIVIITTFIIIARLTAKASLSTLGRTPQEIFYSWR